MWDASSPFGLKGNARRRIGAAGKPMVGIFLLLNRLLGGEGGHRRVGTSVERAQIKKVKVMLLKGMESKFVFKHEHIGPGGVIRLN